MCVAVYFIILYHFILKMALLHIIRVKVTELFILQRKGTNCNVMSQFLFLDTLLQTRVMYLYGNFYF